MYNPVMKFVVYFIHKSWFCHHEMHCLRVLLLLAYFVGILYFKSVYESQIYGAYYTQ